MADAQTGGSLSRPHYVGIRRRLPFAIDVRTLASVDAIHISRRLDVRSTRPLIGWGSVFGIIGVALVVTGCQDPVTTAIPLAPTDPEPPVGVPSGFLPSVHGEGFGVLLPNARITLCAADVRRPGRDGPMLSRRAALSLSRAAFEESDGSFAAVAYQRFDPEGRLIQEVRCTIPRSPRAQEEFVSRFSLSAPRQRSQAINIEESYQGTDEVAMMQDPIPIDGITVEVCASDSVHPDCLGDEEECDPWWDLNWCQCEQETMVIGESADGMSAFGDNCHGGGGDGDDEGDGGGGGTPPPDDDDEECRPYTDPRCVHRYMDDWTQSELAALGATVWRLTQNGCHALANVLDQKAQAGMLGLWDYRQTVWGGLRYGRYVVNEPGEVYSHFILAWSGAGRQPDDGWNLYRIFTHEAAHALGAENHSDPIFATIPDCLGDLYSPQGFGNPNMDLPY
jgi:hypothetical protein